MKQAGFRLRAISIFILIAAIIFIAKLYMLQVVDSDTFTELAGKQYSRPAKIFNRGAIFFESRSGALISAATIKAGFTLAMIPKELKEPEEAYRQINEILPIDREKFFEKAAKKDDPYEEIEKKVDNEIGKKIDALDIAGIRLYREQWRSYPGEDSASHVLGLIAFKGDKIEGRYGLERQYEKTLTRSKDDLYANFFVETFSSLKKGILKGETPEGDIVSTIEPTVQSTLEESIDKVQEKFNSAETGGIIIDPKTGEIVALASLPSFNPNSFQNVTEVKVFSNPLVEEVREMGSIIKPLTMAAGIDAGVITSKSTYFDSGSVTFDTETVYNFDKKGRGQVDMQTVLSKSLNTGMAFIVGKLGTTKFRQYMLDFGLGERTNIDLPNEALNIVTNFKSPRTIEYITASFGQGIALTPVSTVKALSVVANGGTTITPHLVKKINFKTGLFNTIKYDEGKRVLKKETTEDVTRMLVEAVDTALLEGKGKNPHYSVAAKTGTAQLASPTGGYYDDRFLHSFVGYFPAYNPKFLVFLYTVNPKNVEFASNTLAEPFLDLSKFLINYYEIPPDR